MASKRSAAMKRRRRPDAVPEVVRIDAMTNVALDDTLQFMRVLWVVVHALQTASKRMRRELGVTGPQRLVMRVVGLSPGVSAGALAKILHLHPSTLTGILQRLQAQGVINRTAAAADARRAVFRLTVEGQRVNLATCGTVETAVRAALAHVSVGDRRIAQDVLASVATRLNADAMHPRPVARRQLSGRIARAR